MHVKDVPVAPHAKEPATAATPVHGWPSMVTVVLKAVHMGLIVNCDLSNAKFQPLICTETPPTVGADVLVTLVTTGTSNTCTQKSAEMAADDTPNNVAVAFTGVVEDVKPEIWHVIKPDAWFVMYGFLQYTPLMDN